MAPSLKFNLRMYFLFKINQFSRSQEYSARWVKGCPVVGMSFENAEEWTTFLTDLGQPAKVTFHALKHLYLGPTAGAVAK